MEAQVASRPTLEKILKTLDIIFGPIQTKVKKNGDKTELFIPEKVIIAMEENKLNLALGLTEEDKALSSQGVKAFIV